MLAAFSPIQAFAAQSPGKFTAAGRLAASSSQGWITSFRVASCLPDVLRRLLHLFIVNVVDTYPTTQAAHDQAKKFLCHHEGFSCALRLVIPYQRGSSAACFVLVWKISGSMALGTWCNLHEQVHELPCIDVRLLCMSTMCTLLHEPVLTCTDVCVHPLELCVGVVH